MQYLATTPEETFHFLGHYRATFGASGVKWIKLQQESAFIAER